MTDRKETASPPLQKEIRNVLRKMITDFPELSPLLGSQRDADRINLAIPDEGAGPVGVPVEGGEYPEGDGSGKNRSEGSPASPGDAPKPRVQPDSSEKETGIPSGAIKA